jgi:hypothetical protein
MEGFSSYTDTEYNMIIAKKTGERGEAAVFKDGSQKYL